MAGSAPITIADLCRRKDIDPRVLSFSGIPGGEVVFGPGSLSSLGEKAKGLGANRALLVTDPGLRKAGHEARAMDLLREAGIDYVVYDEVRENPTTRDVDRCVAVAREGQVDLIIGLGGGSSMDTAKGCNFILTNGGHMRDYWGVGKATQPMLPLIAVPTTAGTGSECQSFALIADEETHMKMACGDKKAAAAVSILDPELTLTQPRSVTACTGMDALAHAIETAVCLKRNEVSLAYSRAAFWLLNDGLEKVLQDPRDLEARARMQLGAAFAGTAIENSMLGAAHSTANPLTAHFGTVHGRAVGIMLPHVIRRNRRSMDAERTYDELTPLLEERVEHLLELTELGAGLSELGVDYHHLPLLAREATQQWTAQFNPVPLSEDDFSSLYRAAM